MGAATPAYRAVLATYLQPQRRRFGALAIALLGGIGLQLLNPQLLRYFIDTAAAGGPQQALLEAAGAFMAIAIGSAMTYFALTLWVWERTQSTTAIARFEASLPSPLIFSSYLE